MKIIKIMLLLTTIAFFTSVPFDVETKDCSHYWNNVCHQQILGF